MYDNLKKVGELVESADEGDPIIDQGFYNIYTNTFTSIEDVKNQNTQFLLPKTSALVCKNKDGEISIYTPVGNIYIDEIIDDMFIRQSYRPSRKLTNPLFSRVAMDATRITDTKKAIITLMAQSLCFNPWGLMGAKNQRVWVRDMKRSDGSKRLFSFFYYIPYVGDPRPLRYSSSTSVCKI
jgi:hypothetical protein